MAAAAAYSSSKLWNLFLNLARAVYQSARGVRGWGAVGGGGALEKCVSVSWIFLVVKGVGWVLGMFVFGVEGGYRASEKGAGSWPSDYTALTAGRTVCPADRTVCPAAWPVLSDPDRQTCPNLSALSSTSWRSCPGSWGHSVLLLGVIPPISVHAPHTLSSL